MIFYKKLLFSSIYHENDRFWTLGWFKTWLKRLAWAIFCIWFQFSVINLFWTPAESEDVGKSSKSILNAKTENFMQKVDLNFIRKKDTKSHKFLCEFFPVYPGSTANYIEVEPDNDRHKRYPGTHRYRVTSQYPSKFLNPGYREDFRSWVPLNYQIVPVRKKQKNLIILESEAFFALLCVWNIQSVKEELFLAFY